MLDYNNLDPEVRVLVASADDTSTEALQKLSKDPDSEVRKAVASNPNTPIEILEKLGEEFPEIVIINPIFNLLLLEKPDSRFVRLSLARSSTTSVEILVRLAETEDIDILQAIAVNVNAPEDTVLKLIKKPLDYNHCHPIAMNIAKNSNTTGRILENLIENTLQQRNSETSIYADNAYHVYDIEARAEEILLAVAANPNVSNVSVEILERLRGCLKSQKSCQPFQHETNHSNLNHGF
jgi:Leucine rich repeat variant